MPDLLLGKIEEAVDDLLLAFDVTDPPVPVEVMLQRPKAGMWKEFNLSDLSMAYVNVKQRYSPRSSVARLLVRYIIRSDWGSARRLDTLIADEPAVRAFARAILMPREMLLRSTNSRELVKLSQRFEMPEDDVQQRLTELEIPVENS